MKRKYYYILVVFLLVTIGVAFAGTNFEFKTVNPNYAKFSPYPNGTNEGFRNNSYNQYKQQRQIMEENNITPYVDTQTQEDKSKNQQSQMNVAPNYSVYSPQEYHPTDYKREAVLFIIDFSGSMRDKIGNKKKIDMAIDTMHNILPQLSPKSQLGLRLYGHKGGVTTMDACLASDLVVPVSQNASSKIYSALLNAKARGNTPITYSLKQAVNKDFAGFMGKKRIILLTDGGENCDESPCTYVMNNLTQREDISIDVIAFDINNAEANSQLKCAALVSNGKFYKADTEAQLVNSLTNSLNIEKDVQGVIIKDIK